jgi:hypothetical protein
MRRAYLHHLWRQIPFADSQEYRCAFMRSFRNGSNRASNTPENVQRFEQSHHDTKMVWYIGDECQSLQDVKRSDPPISQDYTCEVVHQELLCPPSSRVLPRIPHDSAIPILQLARLAVIHLPPGHVYRIVEKHSVIIYPDGRI